MKKNFAFLLCLILPLVLFFGCSKNYTPKYQIQNNSVVFAAKTNSELKALFEENKDDEPLVYEKAIEDIDVTNKAFGIFVSVAALVDSYYKLGITVNLKVEGDSYELSQGDTVIKLTYGENTANLNVAGENAGNYNFTFKEEETFRMQSEQYIYEMVKKEGKSYVLLAVKKDTSYNILNIVFTYDREIEQMQSYSLTSYTSHSEPRSIIDETPNNYGTGSGSIHYELAN